MLQCDYKIYNLEFEYPFRISKGVKTHQPTMIIYLGLGAQYGLGEATAIHYYGMDIERLTQDIDRVLPEIRRYAYNGPQRFWHFLHHLIPDNNFIISALDCASWDLHAKLQGKKIFELLHYKWGQNVPTDYTLGISAIDELMTKTKKHPFPIYKVKLNNNLDASALAWLLDNTSTKLRLDINEGWNIDDAQQYLPLLDSSRIDLIEQPFKRDDIDSLSKFKLQTSIPIIADEAIQTLVDVEKYIDLYDGINIKLSKCGGITPALRIIEMLQQKKKLIMLGSMSESSVGAAAIAQLLPIADFADIDGPLLLKDDVVKGFNVDMNGKISLTAGNGIGVHY